jgi:HEPN domain-containing protein
MDNFYKTAKRMQKSSKILHDNGDYHNACYLAGYVVECYAKIIVGMSYSFSHEDIAKEFGHDLKKLNKELEYVLAHSSYSTYIVDLKEKFADVLSGESKWNPIKRYSQNTWTQNNSTKFQEQISTAIGKLTDLSLNESSNLI